jgi:hypothetical protein
MLTIAATGCVEHRPQHVGGVLDVFDGEPFVQLADRAVTLLCSTRLISSSYWSELSIAFSKIDGFEVTPHRPSSSISFFRSPFTMKPRDRKSSHTTCPCC